MGPSGGRRSMNSALRRVITAGIAVLALSLAAPAGAAASTLEILTPANGSSTLSTTPLFSGTAGGALGEVTVSVHQGSTAAGSVVLEGKAAPNVLLETWELALGPLTPGVYTAVAAEEGLLGETLESEPATFTVQAAPVVTLDPTDQTVEAGETASFTSAATGFPAPSIHWQVSTDGGAHWTTDVADAGNTTGTLSVTATAGKNGAQYRAVFANAAGEAVSEAATLEVHTPPVVTANPADETVIAGETATFEAAATGLPAPGVQWQVSTDGGAHWSDDTTDSGNTTTTLSVLTKGSQNGNQYRAVFSNAAGEAVSEAAALEVDTPPTITGDPANKAVNAGETATFKASASGFPAPTVQWQVSTNGGGTWSNDTTDSGNTTTTLTILTKASQDKNQYRAVFTNVAGKATTTAAILEVHTIPVVTLQPTDKTVTAGQTAVFKAAGAGNPGPSVQWQFSADGGAHWSNDVGDAGNDTTTLSVVTTAEEDGYQYRAMFKNVAGETPSEPANLTVRYAPVVTLNPTNTGSIAGETAIFEASANGDPTPTVQWQVSIDGGKTWTNDTTDTGSTKEQLLIKKVSLAQSGNEYRAVFTNLVGTATSTAAVLTVSEKQVPPSVSKDPTSLAVTTGAPAVFTATATGVPTPTVQWEVSTDSGITWAKDLTDSGVHTGTLEIAATTAGQDGNEYRAMFKNAAGEAASAPATLTVQTAPGVTLQPISTSVKEGDTATFTAAASGEPVPQVQWEESADGTTWTAIPGANGGTLTLPAVPLALNGRQYRAAFSNLIGAVKTSAATLNVTSIPVPPPPTPPQASFTWLPAAPRAGETVSLASTSTDASAAITGFAWDPAGNGPLVGGGANLTTSFAGAGNHVVRLRVTDAIGQSALVSETIPVGAALPRLMQPFPIVRIAGSDSASGAKVSLLTVLAPSGATITVSCRGHGCPPKHEMRVIAPSARGGVALVSFKRFQRSLNVGAVLVIRVWKTGVIGKYTSFTIRRGKLPKRTDMCLTSATSKPMPCPSS